VSTVLTNPEAAGGSSPGSGPVVGVVVPARSVMHDLRAIKVVWHRELLRFAADRLRILTVLIQPALFLFVLGSGLSSLTRVGGGAGGALGGFSFRTFMFPGALCMTVLFTAIFSAGSIVWDREFGFLREMLVAPVSRGAIVIGKCLGGATVAGIQGVLVLALAGLVGVPYSPSLIFTVLGELLLLALTLTAFGVMMAARIQQFQAFMALNQMLLMPLFFLSGALYPLSRLPAWLQVLTRINPVTYAVDPVRRAVFDHLAVTPAVRHVFDPGLTWNGWRVPVGVELLIVAAIGAAMLVVAMLEFRTAE
jgi:daunorubicin resistance ABC transporter membrane protein